MKKQELINLLDNLQGFLDNMLSLHKHPYGNGIDVEKVINDLKTYVDDMKAVAADIQEVEEENIDQ